jgi:hypothetical protein
MKKFLVIQSVLISCLLFALGLTEVYAQGAQDCLQKTALSARV